MKFFTRNLSIHSKKCQNFQTKNKLKELILGGDYMILVSRDEILSRFAEIPAVL